MEPRYQNPFDKIAVELERITTDGTSAADRAARLRGVKGQLQDLLGQADRYIADVGKAAQSELSNAARAVLQARARADLREGMIESGHSEEVLDAEGMLSHAELDRLSEEGLLEETVVALAARIGQSSE